MGQCRHRGPRGQNLQEHKCAHARTRVAHASPAGLLPLCNATLAEVGKLIKAAVQVKKLQGRPEATLPAINGSRHYLFECSFGVVFRATCEGTAVQGNLLFLEVTSGGDRPFEATVRCSAGPPKLQARLRPFILPAKVGVGLKASLQQRIEQFNSDFTKSGGVGA